MTNIASHTDADLTVGGGVAEVWAPYEPRRVRPPRQVAVERVVGGLFERAEAAFVVIALFLFSGALVPLLLRELSGVSLSGGTGNPVLRMTYGAVHLGTLLLVMVRWRAVVAAAARHRWTIALIALALLSVLWSTDPGLTLRRSFAFLATSALGVYLAARFETRTLLKILAVTFGMIAVLSALFAVALPHLGLDRGDHAGAWRGVYNQKNNLAQMMALGTIVFLLLRRQLMKRRWVAVAGAALCGGVMVMTTSATAPAMVLVLVAMVPVLRTVRYRSHVIVPTMAATVAAVGIAAALFFRFRDEILVAIGKDPTLTGRTPMWEAVLDMVERRPFLGYGYSAFWTDREGPAGEVWRAIGWTTPNAHSGYLDLLLQLGLIGMGIFLIGALVALVRAVKGAHRFRSSLTLWPPLLIAFVLLYNFTETTLLQQNTIIWVLYVATVCITPARPPAEA